ncbi:MAG: MFS transporter [Rectinemataceae bacterium]
MKEPRMDAKPSAAGMYLRGLVDPYRGLGPSLWAMFFSIIINRFGDFVGAFLALYLTRVLGYGPARAGLVVSFVFAASMAGSLASGRLADSIGRKQALIAAQAGTVTVNLALVFFWSKPWAPGLIAFGSFLGGGARPLISAVLTDLAPIDRRKEVFSLQYWAINVGVAFGPLMAAFFFDHATFMLFGASAICTLVSVTLISRGVRTPKAIHAVSILERHDDRGALKAFLGRPILLAFLCLSLANSLSYSQTLFALPLSLSSVFGPDGPRNLGYLISLNGILVIVLTIPVIRLLRRLDPLRCMALSGAFYVVGFGLMAFKLSFAGYTLSVIIWTLGEIIGANVFGIFIARHSPANWRASFQSFMGLAVGGGNALGPLVAGLLVAIDGGATLWIATAALCGCWGCLSLLVSRWDRRIAG